MTCNCDLMWPVKKSSLHPGYEPCYRLAPGACKFSLLSTKRQMPFCAKKFQFIKYTDLGGRVITSAKDMDLKKILNLMYWCDHFIRPIPQPFIKYFRDIRNRKWGRVTKLELNNYAMLKKPMPLVQWKHCFRIWRIPCMRSRFLRL